MFPMCLQSYWLSAGPGSAVRLRQQQADTLEVQGAGKAEVIS